MRFNYTLVFFILFYFSISSCCSNETIKCYDGSIAIFFRGFSKTELSTARVTYLKKDSSNRIALSSYQLDTSRLNNYGAEEYSTSIIGTDTADIELYLPSAGKTYLVTGIEQKGKRATEERRVCHGLGDKVDLMCWNFVTGYMLNGTPGRLDSNGAVILIVK
jgi:hypothetical protein